jgi:DNA modification methylase
MNDPFLEDLIDKAKTENRTLSNFITSILINNYLKKRPLNEQSQLSLPIVSDSDLTVGLTFKDSKKSPVHRWYPYVEGFSSKYVQETLNKHAQDARNIYDPFGGAGTAQLTASIMGIPSYYSEINPFMSFITSTKVNSVAWAKKNKEVFTELIDIFKKSLSDADFQKRSKNINLEPYYEAFDDRDFFEEKHLRDLLAAKEIVKQITADYPHAQAIFLLAISSIVVLSSNMTRRADLRRRRDDEYKNRVVNVPQYIQSKLNEIESDISQIQTEKMATTELISEDVRLIPATYSNFFDIAITSPPYLNGTNYFRNTKLELWFLDYLKSEKELSNFTDKGITAGINNVRLNRECLLFEPVEGFVQKLEVVSPDRRIPLLVRQYFSDMFSMFQNVSLALKDGGKFIMDIGDSKFYGVHVPTDKLLCYVAEKAGFEIVEINHLAKRYSKDKTPLVQLELIFKKKQISGQKQSDSSMYEDSIKFFRDEVPYKKNEYASRAWGHELHSICSYQGKLKPSIAYWLVELFSKKGDVVLDPLGGVGTIPLEASINGRLGVSNDKSPLAFSIASSKLFASKFKNWEKSLKDFDLALQKIRLDDHDITAAEFGLNAKVKDYYHPQTLEEILRARKYFLNKKEMSPTDFLIKSCILHILHGNRPYALSRTSHPITPFSPKGPAIYKSLLSHVEDKISKTVSESIPDEYVDGISYHGDFRDLNTKMDQKVDVIITSPPFLGMRFDRPNWLRLWFCGWVAESFHVESKSFLERQQTKDMNVYSSFYDTCHFLLKDKGKLIIHVGGSDEHNMVQELEILGGKIFRHVDTVIEDVESVEKHGIKDKGLTKTHNYLFFEKS